MNYPVRIGIIGGGQLGKMLTIAAKNLGFHVTVTDPTPKSPAGQVADSEITGDYEDKKTTLQLAKVCDVITIDPEFVNTKVLQTISKKIPVHPSPRTIEIIKDKLEQKKFLKKNNIQTAPFIEVKTEQDIEKVGAKFGYPLLLKARHHAYDGKGNFTVKSQKNIKEGLEKLKGRQLYVEKFVPFTKELAIMGVRNTKGQIALYPVVQTIHKNHVCDLVIAPAPVSKKAKLNAEKLARKVLKKMKGAGVFGIEMFLKIDNNVLVNEIAPRVHNSGHYTIEAAMTSQFEQHIRAVTGLPLGSTQLKSKAAVMKNILGTKDGLGYPKGIEKALKIPGVSVHIYGKKESRPGRKMGHITVVGNSTSECLKKAEQARKYLII